MQEAQDAVEREIDGTIERLAELRAEHRNLQIRLDTMTAAPLDGRRMFHPLKALGATALVCFAANLLSLVEAWRAADDGQQRGCGSPIGAVAHPTEPSGQAVYK